MSSRTEQRPADDEQRLVRKSDLTELKNDLRREMKLWLALGVAGGNIAAAVVASYLHPSSVPATAARAVVHALGIGL